MTVMEWIKGCFWIQGHHLEKFYIEHRGMYDLLGREDTSKDVSYLDRCFFLTDGRKLSYRRVCPHYDSQGIVVSGKKRRML